MIFVRHDARISSFTINGSVITDIRASILANKRISVKMGYNPGMPRRRVIPSVIRFFYKHFYNRFAFTYDPISTAVSRGEWRAWTRAAIPFVRGPYVLEIAFGTGNLLLDLADTGFALLGVDLSPFMIEISRRKFQARGLSIPIARARVQQLPFPGAHFSSIVMTFPPGFATDPRALTEIRRVLADDGSLIWVDAPYLYPRDEWSRFLNWAYRLTDGAPEPSADDPLRGIYHVNRADLPGDLLPREGWYWRVEKIERPGSHVHVIIGTKHEIM
jgi:SAM-dependent methyltransferase